MDIDLLLGLNIPVDEYFGHLHTWVIHCLNKYNSGIAKLPPDLNMLPYIEDGLIKR